CTSLPSAGEDIFFFIGTFFWAWGGRKGSRFSRTAGESRTRGVARAKGNVPEHMGRAGTLFIVLPPGKKKRTRPVRCRPWRRSSVTEWNKMGLPCALLRYGRNGRNWRARSLFAPVADDEEPHERIIPPDVDRARPTCGLAGGVDVLGEVEAQEFG